MMRLSLSAKTRMGLALAALLASPGLAAAAQPASELPDKALVPLVASFVNSCTKDFVTDPAVGSFYCPCAAAIVVDRLSVDELTKDDAMSMDDMDKAHPGIARLLKACGLAAKLSTGEIRTK